MRTPWRTVRAFPTAWSAMLEPRRLLHPAAHAVMMMVVVTHLVRMRFGQCRGKDSKRDSGDGKNLCSEFHYFFLC